MGDIVTLLQGRRVGLDTSVFIYHLEGTSRFARPAGVVFEELARGSFQGLTSVLTIMELTVKPLQLGRPEVAAEYEMLLTRYPHLSTSSISTSLPRDALPNCVPPIDSALPTRCRLVPAWSTEQPFS